MYTFKPVTDRVRYMHPLIRDRVIQTDALRAQITTESHKKNEQVVPIIKRARIARTTSYEGPKTPSDERERPLFEGGLDREGLAHG